MHAVPIVYTARGCKFCTQLKSFLTENQISYEERDVDANSEFLQQAKDLGNRWLPILTYGERVYVDPTERDLQDLMAQLKPSDQSEHR